MAAITRARHAREEAPASEDRGRAPTRRPERSRQQDGGAAPTRRRDATTTTGRAAKARPATTTTDASPLAPRGGHGRQTRGDRSRTRLAPQPGQHDVPRRPSTARRP
ncbi:MAG: hypothetical protein IPH86_15920 [bacterium]|nr:hypothetical protein [bacterium]